MKFFAVLTLLSAVPARSQVGSVPQTTGGTGPYKAHYYTTTSLPNHTIYEPIDNTGLKIPVVVWGNGGCYIDGAGFGAFLGEVASHGVMLIAPGGLSGSQSGQTTRAWMTQSIDWAIKNGGQGNYSHVDSSRIAAWGQSCGGLEAESMVQDTRVSSIGVFDSGQMSAAASVSVLSNSTKSIFFFIGGSTDIAYANANNDYAAVPSGTPSWKGQNGKGHMSTFFEADGGMVGTAGARYAQWLLRGNSTAGQYFTGDGAKADGWTDIVSKSLANIKVTPIQ